MRYLFGPFELDMDAAELRTKGRRQPLERQVFALLAMLVENRDRLVSKSEIIEKIWDGRFVSDSALSSRVKSLRQALGDDGRAQTYIRTLHRQGFRFVAEVRIATPSVQRAEPFPGTPVTPTARTGAPSLAVLPFTQVGDAGQYASLSDALPHELIADLSRLRWLFVTARGSSFRFREADTDVREIGRLLGVQYVLAGSVEVTGRRLAVTAKLSDTVEGGVIWGDHFDGKVDAVHAVREEIRSRTLAALEIAIPAHEATLARRMPVEDLDAWSAYHVGLQHMYRFNRTDNAAAARMFRRATELDPLFARAHAALSFTHFQTAFMRHTEDVSTEVGEARRHAERGVELDALDPFVNFAMGRTFWLQGDLQSSLQWLERATLISPNYAQGIYAQAWTEALSGRHPEGQRHVDLAMQLSPLDPLYYAMLATRGFTHMAAGEDAAAAAWIERAARSPGAHVLIAMIAAAKAWLQPAVTQTFSAATLPL